MRVYVDHTHLWRHVTGLERITQQLFSGEALAPLDVVPLTASRMRDMLIQQTIGLPTQLARSPSSILLCPGFPPTPLLQLFSDRVIPYIHDVFLISRRADLNWRAKIYSAWPFSLAVTRLPRFLVNSLDTAAKLTRHCRADAEIVVYRPPAQNTFSLTAAGRHARPEKPRTLRLVALGTVEPRKNYMAAARLIGALRERGFLGATLEVIGRKGWGEDWRALRSMPGILLHGYLSDRQAAAVIDGADALICTSHEEGLGLPLLEAQYGGLPVIAPDQPVFREVLDESGVLIDPAHPHAAAARVAAMFAEEGWRGRHVELGTSNLRRWNALAAADHDRVLTMLDNLGRRGKAARLQTAN
jgi:glycosyltransferase involved in cell wall biosynthesis